METVGLEAPLHALARLDLYTGERNTSGERDAARYLRELARTPLELLEQHPAQQAGTAAALAHQRADLCLRHTSTFVKAQDVFEAVPSLQAACDEELTALEVNAVPRMEAAAAAFATAAQRAVSTHAAMQQLQDTYETSLSRLLEMATMVRACVMDADYEEALQLAGYFFRVLPPAADGVRAIVGALRQDMSGALYDLRNELFDGLRGPDLKLPEARRLAGYVTRLMDMARTHYSDTSLHVDASDLCFAFLDARLERARASLQSNALDALDAWKDTVLNASLMALSIFVDHRLFSETPDASASLIAAFAARTTDALVAYVMQHLSEHARVASPTEEAAEHLALLWSRLNALSAILADIGFGLEMADVQDAFNEAALQLWTRALAVTPTTVHSGAAADNAPHAVPRALASRPACAAMSARIVAALNVLRHFAPRTIRPAAVDALRAAVLQHVGGVDDVERDAVLLPWAEAALVEGVFGEN